MAIYSKTAKQLLIDLINEGNPQLPFQINDTDFDFTDPVAIPDPGNGHNTQLRIIAKPDTNYIGNVLVTYRRLNIATIFHNTQLFLEHWVPNTGNNSNQIASLFDLLPLFSEKYGINIEADVALWTDRTLTGRHGVRGDTFQIATHPTNWAYIGSIQAKWLVGERSLDSLLANDIIDGRQWPEDITEGVETRKYNVSFDGFDVDYTEHAATLSSSGIAAEPLGRYESGAYGVFSNILSSIERRDGRQYLVPTRSTGQNYNQLTDSLTNIQPMRYIPPHPDVPHANSEFYNRCIAIRIPDDCPWGQGTIILHYNV